MPKSKQQAYTCMPVVVRGSYATKSTYFGISTRTV